MAQFEETNIMSTEQFEALFDNNGGGELEPPQTPLEPEEPKKPEENNNTTEEENLIDLDNPFNVQSTPESVGSEGNKSDENGGITALGDSSPIYSSLANALAEEGIPFDSENKIEDIKDAKSLVEALKKAVLSLLDEELLRVSNALNNGVEPNLIKSYEYTIKLLDGITDELLSAENELSENLRKQIIFRDYINRGFTQERAQREVEKAVTNGTDIEDAKEALSSIKETVKSLYNAELKKAEDLENAVLEDRKLQAHLLRKGILEGKELFGDLELDKLTRLKVLDNIIKPIYIDPETGDKLTAIQKYEAENRVEFLKKIGIIFTLTDGFKSLDGLVKGKVRKEMGKGMKELEAVINNTQRNSDGSLSFAGGVNTDDLLKFSSFALDI